MPRLPIDYANTVIYKIVCNDLNITECYVGHTTDFVRRKQSHKYTSGYVIGKDYNSKLYKTIRENGGFSNWSMIEIEKYPCTDVNEARKKEREWYENIDFKLNMCYPTRNRDEYYEINKNQIREQMRMYNQNHKQEISKQQKERRESHKKEISIRRSKRIICECGIEINLYHKSRHLKTKIHNDNLNTLI